MKSILLFFVIIAFLGSVVLWVRHGGGEAYPDLSTAPVLSGDALDEVLSYPEPIGNVAVSRNGRVFFTVHPESRPLGNRLLEYVEGAAVPYPDLTSQLDLFDAVLGIVIDRNDRLWTIDHGNHGLREPRLMAFDLRDGAIVVDHVFDGTIAPAGSFVQDLQVSRDGRTVVIADTSFWRKRPAIIVFDTETRAARRVLENHHALAAEPFVIVSGSRQMSFAGGMLSYRGGVDGMALDDEWLYFGALSGSGLYRIRLSDLRDEAVPASQLAARVERYSDKPLSDGFSADLEGNVYVTDVEHNSVFIVGEDREARTLISSGGLRWPGSLSFGPDGWLYVADSALSDVVFKSKDHIKNSGPYKIFRFRPGTEGTPGH
ncbi:MAG: L-dopachrome tautomerase-related protein [Woeseiaceae bacterium]|nr:L-dopachrome tautomerase-related protein [Woeseiaceae bacterium]